MAKTLYAICVVFTVFIKQKANMLFLGCTMQTQMLVNGMYHCGKTDLCTGAGIQRAVGSFSLLMSLSHF